MRVLRGGAGGLVFCVGEGVLHVLADAGPIGFVAGEDALRDFAGAPAYKAGDLLLFFQRGGPDSFLNDLLDRADGFEVVANFRFGAARFDLGGLLGSEPVIAFQAGYGSCCASCRAIYSAWSSLSFRGPCWRCWIWRSMRS